MPTKREITYTVLLVILIVIGAAFASAGTQDVKIDTVTHKVIKPPPSTGAAFDISFADVTTDLSGGGGGGTPGGASSQLQFNNSFTFGGVPYATYDGTTVQFRTGSRFTFADLVDPTKKVQIGLGAFSTGTLRTISPAPGADSVTVVPSGGLGTGAAGSNTVVVGIGTDGVLHYTQLAFSNLSGTLALSQTTMGTNKLVGRATAGTGAMEEITIGANLTLDVPTKTLSATGGASAPGGSNTQVQFNDSGALGGISSMTTNGTAVTQKTGSNFLLVDPTVPTKTLQLDLSNIAPATSRTLVIPNGNSTLVIPDAGASNNFLTGISSLGVVTKAQPAFSNISGRLTGLTQNNLPIGKGIWVDATNGNDTGPNAGARGDLTRPFLTIGAAFAAASAGDVIYIGPGTFAQAGTPLVIPAGVEVVGSGADYTLITSTVAISTNRAGVEGLTSGSLSSVTVQNTNAAGAAFGVGSSSTAFTSFFLSSCKFISNRYGIWIAKTGTTGLSAENVNIQSQEDGLNMSVAGTHSFRNSDFYCDGTPSINARGIVVSAGTVIFRDGSLTAINAATINEGVFATGATSLVELHNVSITINTSAATNFDLAQASSAVIKKENVARTDGTALSNVGTITDLLSVYTGNIADDAVTDTKVATTFITNQGADATPTLDDLMLTYDPILDQFRKVSLNDLANNLTIDTVFDSISGFGYNFDTSLATANHGVRFPDADSVTVIPAIAGAGQAVTSISSSGVIGFGTFSGGGTPGGSNTQLQYNNSGAFGGVSTLTFSGSALQMVQGANTTFVDSTDNAKKMRMDVSNVTTANTRIFSIPDANFTGVIGASATSNQFLTNITTAGVQTKAQPALADLSDASSVVTLTGSQSLSNKTIVTPVMSTGLTASGSASNDFSASTGTFKTSSGANTLNGAVQIADATTPSLTTASGKTNTGFVLINGKTSGGFKIIPVDALAQNVTFGPVAQTVGAATLNIPDLAGTNRNVVTDTSTQTLSNKTLVAPALGTPVSGTLTNCTFPTLNQDTTGSAASLSISGQSGLLTFTGLASTNRVKTVRDAADTILELGGNYTPTGTWTSLTMVTPVLGIPTSGTLTNCTGLPVAGITSSTSTALGVGSLELGHATDTTIARSGAGAITVEGVQVLLSGAALGTPSSGTLSNCDQLPIAGLTSSTTTPLGVGSIELGHGTDTTLSRSAAGKLAVEGTDVLLNGGALGTPSSGTLTNATGLPVSGITSSTSTALGVGSLEVGHATDTTLSRVSAGVLGAEGKTIQATTSTSGVRQGLMSVNGSSVATLATHAHANGTSTSGTPGTSVASIAAGAGNQFVDINCVCPQSNSANVQLTATITYADSTTTTVTTSAGTAQTVFINSDAMILTQAGGYVSITAHSAKAITTIAVVTAGTGTGGTRAASLAAVEISQ